MSDFNFNPNEIISARQRFGVPPKKNLEPKRDELISKIVGKPVLQSDPRLLKVIMKYKNNKPLDSKTPDNFLENPAFVKELKEVLNTSL